VLVVCGLGGAGKSQLVLNYVQEYRADYAAVFWIEAGQKQTVERDYLQIYRLLFDGGSASTHDRVTIEDAVAAIKSWFCGRTGRWLVVFDSADSIDNDQDPLYIDLGFFLPDAPVVDVIITSRSSRAKDMTRLEAVSVEEMEPAEAAQLFVKSAKLQNVGRETKMEVALIIKELGYLALAVMLAGSHVSVTPRLSLDIRQYLPEYRRQRKRLLSRKPTRYIHRYGESVLSTWETSFSAIAAQSIVASRLLSLLAFMNYDDIFLALFYPATRNTNQQSEEVTASGQQWTALISPEEPLDVSIVESAFEVLQTYSLVQWKVGQESYSMHKLVHAWGQDRLEIQEQSRWNFAALQLLGETIPRYHFDPVSKLRLRPHLMACFSITHTMYTLLNLRDRARLDLVNTIGNFLNTAGEWTDVLEIRLFYSRNLRQILGAEHPVA
jgi:hypothetical protein